MCVSEVSWQNLTANFSPPSKSEAYFFSRILYRKHLCLERILASINGSILFLAPIHLHRSCEILLSVAHCEDTYSFWSCLSGELAVPKSYLRQETLHHLTSLERLLRGRGSSFSARKGQSNYRWLWIVFPQALKSFHLNEAPKIATKKRKQWRIELFLPSGKKKSKETQAIM